MDSVNKEHESVACIEEIIHKLDLHFVEADGDGELASPNEDISSRSVGDSQTAQNGETRMTAGVGDQAKGGKGGQEEDKKKSGPLEFIRKLRTSSSSSDGKSGSSSEAGSTNKRKLFEQLKVDSLPQSFIAKYVGCKACRGLWGIQHTREPVDGLVEDLRRLDHRSDDLPLVRLEVSSGGISIAVHPRNRSQRPVSDLGLLPLEFISYAVQDTRYSRIFAFILVRELSSRGRATECHAYLCDTAVSARKMALSVALAFKLYERSLQGKPFRFAVDLRSPDELQTEVEKPAGAASASTDAGLTAEYDA